MVGENLQAGPHDEQHEDHVEEVLHLQPPGKAGIDRRRRLGNARMLLDEGGDGRQLAQTLRQGDEAKQSGGPERQRPERIHPAPPDADARHDTGLWLQPVIEAHIVIGRGEPGAKRLGCWDAGGGRHGSGAFCSWLPQE
jgi:hypothetical protein